MEKLVLLINPAKHPLKYQVDVSYGERHYITVTTDLNPIFDALVFLHARPYINEIAKITSHRAPFDGRWPAEPSVAEKVMDALPEYECRTLVQYFLNDNGSETCGTIWEGNRGYTVPKVGDTVPVNMHGLSGGATLMKIDTAIENLPDGELRRVLTLHLAR